MPRGSNDHWVGKKWRTLKCFSGRGQGVVRRGQRIGWLIKTLEALVGHFIDGYKFAVSERMSCKNNTTLVTFPRRWCFSFKNALQSHQQRWVILRVDILAIWKVINADNAVLIQKNPDENFSSEFFNSECFGAGWGERKWRHAADCCLSPGHNDTTMFRPLSTLGTGNLMDPAEPKIFKSSSDESKGTVDVFHSRSGISRPT